MSMLIVSDSEFELELSRLTNHNRGCEASRAATSNLITTDDNRAFDSTNNANNNDNEKAKILDTKLGPSAVIIESKLGRGPTKEIPSSVRNVIAGESISGTSAKVIQNEFPISQSSISAYKRGSTSLATLDNKDSSLVEHNNKLRHKISNSARNRLILALKHITEDKLSSAKVRDAASVAKDMSVIVKNMNEQSEQSQTNVQFIIHRPRMKELSEFEVIDVSD